MNSKTDILKAVTIKMKSECVDSLYYDLTAITHIKALLENDIDLPTINKIVEQYLETDNITKSTYEKMIVLHCMLVAKTLEYKIDMAIADDLGVIHHIAVALTLESALERYSDKVKFLIENNYSGYVTLTIVGDTNDLYELHSFENVSI